MLSKKRRNLIFLEALILTLILYSFGIILNDYLDEIRIQEINYKTSEFENKYNSLIVAEVFFSKIQNENKSNICSIKKKYILKNFIELKILGNDLNNYGQLFLKNNANVSLNKQREYFINEFSLYRNTLIYNNECSDKLIPILYFYDSLNPKLDKQSLILEQFSLNNKNDSLILAFDINYNKEPLLNEIKNQYSVYTTPFIIIGNKTSQTLENQNGLLELETITKEFVKLKNKS